MLHTALRNRANTPVLVDGQDVMPEVNAVLDRMAAFATGVRDGSIAASDGGRFTDVVNIGIGGSDLGPVMVTLALAPYHDGPRTHYVSNVDGAHVHDTLAGLDPARTLVIVASKTFTTIETMTNAKTAQAWLKAALGDKADGHFAAVSTALDKTAAFGIDASRVFGFWDWVGGRYSVWGAVGLPVMLAIGPERFGEFLDGAHAMDRHFATAPLPENLPVLLGLIGIWHRDVHGLPVARHPALRPAAVAAARLPAAARHGIERQGRDARRQPGRARHRPGRLGRARHQRPARLLPADPPGHRRHPLPSSWWPRTATSRSCAHHHELLLANCLAQSEALMKGRTLEEARATVKDPALAPHKVFPGNRPSTTLVYARLDPATLGRDHRALRAPGVRRGRDLGHQQLRPVGGRARQGARHRALAAGAGRRRLRGQGRLHRRPARAPSPRCAARPGDGARFPPRASARRPRCGSCMPTRELLVVDKPSGLLSVPAKPPGPADCVEARLRGGVPRGAPGAPARPRDLGRHGLRPHPPRPAPPELAVRAPAGRQDLRRPGRRHGRRRGRPHRPAARLRLAEPAAPDGLPPPRPAGAHRLAGGRPRAGRDPPRACAR